MDSLNHRFKSISRERLILTLIEYIPREIYKLCRLHGQSQQQDPMQTDEKPNIELHLHLDLASAQCYQLPTSVPSDHQTSSFRKVPASRVEVEKIFRACSQHFSHRTLQLSGIEGQILRQVFSDIQKIIHSKKHEKNWILSRDARTVTNWSWQTSDSDTLVTIKTWQTSDSDTPKFENMWQACDVTN